MGAEYDFSQGKRGAIELIVAGKTRITVRLDDDVLAWFREQVRVAGGIIKACSMKPYANTLSKNVSR